MASKQDKKKPPPKVVDPKLRDQTSSFDPRVQVAPMTSPPYNWICHLEIKYGDGANPSFASGFKINLPDMKFTVVVTAGHCVYNKQFKRYAHEITVIFPGQEPVIVSAAGKRPDDHPFEVHHKYTSAFDEDYDYGFILLPGNSNEGFGWSTEMTNANLENRLVSVCGYPSEKGESGSMWITGGKISEVTDRRIIYENDTTPGQSGSPVYTWHRGAWTVVAVHVGLAPEKSQDSGVRFTYQMISHLVRRAGIVKKLKSASHHAYIWCNGKKVEAQHDAGENERFYIYPVEMLPSLVTRAQLQKVVIKSVKSENAFISLDSQDMKEYAKSGGGAVTCIDKVESSAKFYLKDEEEDSSQVSIVSVAFPKCRIRLHSGTVNCQYYSDMDVAASDTEQFQIIRPVD